LLLEVKDSASISLISCDLAASVVWSLWSSVLFYGKHSPACKQ